MNKLFLSSFPPELHQHVYDCHQQFQELVNSQQIKDEFTQDQYLEIIRVLSCSNFVFQTIRKQSDWFFSSLDNYLFDKPRNKTELEDKISNLFLSTKSLDELSKQLRLFRNQEMLFIAWRDISGKANLNEIMSQLSLLAELCISYSLKWLQNYLKNDFGTPVDNSGSESQMLIMAMGKLGACELNFSSDIDLIFVFPEHGTTINGRRSISNNEFFIKLGQQLIKLLNETTAYGFVFRVDMRLRPFGKSGPLAVSIDAMEGYYAEHGREWERYALIKARLLSGNTEDKMRLQQLLKPFVFRRYIDFSAFESLREMKQMISNEVKQKNLQHNIKLGAGGIREIEFIAQAFQLLRGGREKEFQQRSVQAIIILLSKKQIITEDIANSLLTAYQFLRDTEHRIQQFNDQQKHVLPDSEFSQVLLAYAMNFNNRDRFLQQLALHQSAVQKAFTNLFELPQSKQANEESDKQHLAILWLETLEQIDKFEPEINLIQANGHNQINKLATDNVSETKNIALELLKKSRFKHTEEILKVLLSFRQSYQFRKMSNNARERLNQLMPTLLYNLAKEEHNDFQYNQTTILKRLLAVIESICRRSVYLVLLTENPQALLQLIKLCAASSWISRELVRTPALLDELLDPQVLYSPLKQEDLTTDLLFKLKNCDVQDLEQQMEVLRHFKLTHVFRVACADISGAIPITKVSDYLTWIAETILQQVIAIAWKNTAEKMPEPHHGKAGDGFAVIGYGKMGGLELGYSSDLDLVFVYQNKYKQQAHFFIRLSQRIMHILATHSYSGVLYECDMRLRPDGNAGQIACSLDSFRRYQLDKAWLWEHQALCRSRIVAGDKKLTDDFSTIRQQVICQAREINSLQFQVNQMRNKMFQSLAPGHDDIFDVKQSYGGLVDIEFIVQFLILNNANRYPEIISFSDNLRMIESLVKFGLISSETGSELSLIYQEYRDYAHHQALQELSATCSLQKFSKQKQTINNYWNKYISNERSI